MVKRRASIFNLNLTYRPQDTVSGKSGWIVSWITESGDEKTKPTIKEYNFKKNYQAAQEFYDMKLGLK